MLVLSRKLGQRIMIGENIEVVVTENKGGVVRLGIVAPKDVPIHREEVFYRIQREEQQIGNSVVDTPLIDTPLFAQLAE